MTSSRQAVRAGAVLAALALTAAACGGSSSNSKKSSSSSSSSGGSTTKSASGFNAAVNGVANVSSKTGGTLQLAATGDCDSWDPARTYYAWCLSDMQRLITRTLVAFKAAPGKEGNKESPDLATALGQTTDSKNWTYHLKSGLKFENGQPITSKDIKYGIERVFATDVINGGPGYVICLLSTCAADGSSPYKGPYKDKNGLSSIETPDDSTIIFHLVKPYSDWDYIMGLAGSGPVPQAADTGAKYTNHPVASGPFMFKNYQPGKSLQLVRNPNWSQSTDTIRHPKVDSVVLTINSNADDNDNRLQQGNIDLEPDGGVQPTFQTKIITQPSLKKYADNPITGFTRYLAIIPSVIPNIHCRRAMFYAINKSDLRLSRGGEYGGDFANSMTPPVQSSYDKNLNPYPDGSDFKGDLTKAKSELQQCGKPTGFSTNMAYVPTGRGKAAFEATQQALSRVGIKVNSAPGSQSSYYTTYIGSPANLKSKGLGIALAGWGPDFPTGTGFWYSISNGSSILPTGNSNYPSINDPTINDAEKKAQASTSQSDKDQLFQTVDKRIMELAVYLPFVYDKTLYYRNPRTTNIYLLAGAGNYYDYVNVGVSS